MSITIKNQNNYELADNLAQFFYLDMSLEPLPDYIALKKKVIDSELNLEEKNHLINLITSLDEIKDSHQKQLICEEINELAKKYNLL